MLLFDVLELFFLLFILLQLSSQNYTLPIELSEEVIGFRIVSNVNVHRGSSNRYVCSAIASAIFSALEAIASILLCSSILNRVGLQ